MQFCSLFRSKDGLEEMLAVNYVICVTQTACSAGFCSVFFLSFCLACYDRDLVFGVKVVFGRHGLNSRGIFPQSDFPPHRDPTVSPNCRFSLCGLFDKSAQPRWSELFSFLHNPSPARKVRNGHKCWALGPPSNLTDS